MAGLVGHEQLLGHDEFDLQRTRSRVPAAQVEWGHHRWMPRLARFVRDGGGGWNAGVLRHRPQRDLPTVAGPDRRRTGRLQRGGPDRVVGHASSHLHRGHLADLLRQRPHP